VGEIDDCMRRSDLLPWLEDEETVRDAPPERNNGESEKDQKDFPKILKFMLIDLYYKFHFSCVSNLSSPYKFKKK
jgi:hypothetical protein